MNITEIPQKIKIWKGSQTGQTVLLILVIIMTSIISYYIGKTSNNDLTVESTYSINKAQDYSLADPEIYKSGSLAAAIMNGSLEPQNAPELSQNGAEGINTYTPQNSDITTPRYVSSKNGRVYYFTWCAGAKRILEENRIYYKNSRDARAAGLNPSSACPGLD